VNHHSKYELAFKITEVKLLFKSERKEREFNIRRAEILEQAEKIFAAKGFHDVTMAEIANASGFSIGSLYQFFQGKEHLYTTMISEKIDLMYAKIQQEVKSADTLTDKIAALIDARLHFVENNADFCRIFLRGENEALSEIMTSIRQKLIDDYYQHISFIEKIFKSGAKSGLLRSLSARDMANVLSHLIRAASVDWLIVPSKEPLSSKKAFILDIFLHGVKKYE
jgi:AcrR family transcriptional regulator